MIATFVDTTALSVSENPDTSVPDSLMGTESHGLFVPCLLTQLCLSVPLAHSCGIVHASTHIHAHARTSTCTHAHTAETHRGYEAFFTENLGGDVSKDYKEGFYAGRQVVHHV